jgi:hypothetical protein
MSIDSVLRTLGVLTCVYTVGLFVSVMTTAALNVASYNAGTLCSDRTCTTVAANQSHHGLPQEPDYPAGFRTAALFIAGNI